MVIYCVFGVFSLSHDVHENVQSKVNHNGSKSCDNFVTVGLLAGDLGAATKH